MEWRGGEGCSNGGEAVGTPREIKGEEETRPFLRTAAYEDDCRRGKSSMLADPWRALWGRVGRKDVFLGAVEVKEEALGTEGEGAWLRTDRKSVV